MGTGDEQRERTSFGCHVAVDREVLGPVRQLDHVEAILIGVACPRAVQLHFITRPPRVIIYRATSISNLIY